jgi:hypothetical protein
VAEKTQKAIGRASKAAAGVHLIVKRLNKVSDSYRFIHFHEFKFFDIIKPVIE